MIKNILVPLDGSEFSESAMECAFHLAKKFGASVSAMHVVDSVALEGSFLHDVSGSMGFEPFMDFSTRMKTYLDENGKAILKAFSERAEKAGIKSHTTLAFGVVASEICDAAAHADLVIIGRRGGNAAFEYALMGSVAETVVRKSPKPVLIVPGAFKAPKTLLLAYDGSAGAGKAMHSAAEFAKTLGLGLTVLTVAPAGRGESLISDAGEYLLSYDIKPEFAHIDGDPHLDIVRYCADKKVDMVFMGAFHHSRVVELVLGSTTEYVMRKIDALFFLEK